MSTLLQTPKEFSTKEIFDNPYMFLDDTLRALLLESETNPNPIPREQVFALMNVDISFRDREIVLRHLVKDGNVDSIMKSRNEMKHNNAFQSDIPNVECFFITFKGAKLLLDGGYTISEKSRKSQKKLENVKMNLLIFGSLTAGLGAALLFLEDFVKHCASRGYRWLFSMHLLQFWVWLASGIVIGITALILIQKALKVHDK